MSRFDYVKYDQPATAKQLQFKELFTLMETGVAHNLPEGRAKSLVLTKLEEAYMWIGKAIRDEQIQRNKDTELQEERTNS